MPELPEVETMVRGIRADVVGRRIDRTEICRCTRKPICIRPSRKALVKNTQGKRITSVDRLAKRVLLTVETGDSVVIEPRMTGLVLVTSPPTRAHRRVCWHLEPATGRAPDLQFWDRRGLGTISLLNPVELQDLRGRLGIDALEIELQQVRSRLAGTKRAIKVALLDQHLVAGIGNLYASEILHRAGIGPFRPANALTPAQERSLLKAIGSIMREAIQSEGSTLSDGTYRNALNQDGSYQNEHRVYQRAGEKCGRCQRGSIERVVQAQRSTFYCPKCQK